MKTKERAEELVERMYQVHSSWASDITWYFAKQCALVAVNEILTEMSDYFDKYDCTDTLSKIEYWTEVKQEIENI